MSHSSILEREWDGVLAPDPSREQPEIAAGDHGGPSPRSVDDGPPTVAAHAAAGARLGALIVGYLDIDDVDRLPAPDQPAPSPLDRASSPLDRRSGRAAPALTRALRDDALR